jgi:hypothetical protein
MLSQSGLNVFSFLADMRKHNLEPWLDDEGWIHIAYQPDEQYFAYLKANKTYALAEIRAEALLGVRFENNAQTERLK